MSLGYELTKFVTLINYKETISEYRLNTVDELLNIVLIN